MAAKQIAPRLASGHVRDSLYGRLPAEIKSGLRTIARMERKSMSWVIEEVVIDYFGMRAPRYVQKVTPRTRRRRVA